MGMPNKRLSRAPLRSMKTGSITRLKAADRSGERELIRLSLRKLNSIRTVITRVNAALRRPMRRKIDAMLCLLAQASPALGAELAAGPNSCPARSTEPGRYRIAARPFWGSLVRQLAPALGSALPSAEPQSFLVGDEHDFSGTEARTLPGIVESVQNKPLPEDRVEE
jgi:hypothetical protein